MRERDPDHLDPFLLFGYASYARLKVAKNLEQSLRGKGRAPFETSSYMSLSWQASGKTKNGESAAIIRHPQGLFLNITLSP